MIDADFCVENVEYLYTGNETHTRSGNGQILLGKGGRIVYFGCASNVEYRLLEFSLRIDASGAAIESPIDRQLDSRTLFQSSDNAKRYLDALRLFQDALSKGVYHIHLMAPTFSEEEEALLERLKSHHPICLTWGEAESEPVNRALLPGEDATFILRDRSGNVTWVVTNGIPVYHNKSVKEG